MNTTKLQAGLIVALTLIVAGCSKTPQEKAEDLYRKGLKQLSANHYKDADSTFSELSAKFADSPLGMLGKAQAKESQLLYYDALEMLLRLQEKQPRPKELSPLLARLYLKLGDNEQAWRSLSDYIGVEKIDIDAMLVYIEGLIGVGRLGQAQQAVDLAVKRGLTELEAQPLRAEIQFLKRHVDSSKMIANAIVAGNKSPTYYRLLADYLEVTEQLDSSMAMSREAINVSRNDVTCLLNHFNRALRTGYLYEARRVIEQVREIDPDSMLVDGLSMFYSWAIPDPFRANQSNDRFFGRASQDLTGYFYDIESRWLTSDLASCNSDVDAINLLAEKRSSPASFVQYIRGRLVMAYTKVFEPQTDITSLRASQGYKNDQPEYRMMECYHMAMSKQMDVLNENVGIIQDYRGQDPLWMTGLGNIYASKWLQDYKAADGFYRIALKYDSLYKPALEGLINTQLSLFGPDSALAMFDHYWDLEALYPTLSVSRAILLVITGKPDTGLAYMQAHVGPIRGKVAPYLLMAEQLRKASRPDLVQRLYDQMLEMNPENPDILVECAREASNLGRYEASAQLTDRALKIEPTNQQAQVQKARAAFEMGNRELGASLFEQVLLKADGDPEANMYYAAALTWDTANAVNMVKAGNLARSAYFYDRASLRSTLNLCYVYMRDRRYDLLKGEARKGVMMNPNSPELYYYYGLALTEGVEKDGAKYFEQALKLGLSGDMKIHAEELLKKK